MPELPEMETYRRLLEPRILHKSILSVEVEREKSVNLAVERFRSAVQYHTVVRIQRIAKQLIFWLDDGNGLVLHLMLGGWMFYGNEQERPDRTIQVKLGFGKDNLYFINLRLGHLHLLNRREIDTLAQKYGPDPFDPQLTEADLHRILSKKRSALKPVLVDQSILAGIGNCYSDEICFAARILPTRSSSTLDIEDCQRLLEAMRMVLKDAVQYGGYMEHPLYADDPLTGGFDERCRVYDREGEACVRCSDPIKCETIGSRKTYFCINCQR